MGVALMMLVGTGQGIADSDVSSSTSTYFSSNGSLGVPVFGTYASLDNGLRPVVGYTLQGGPVGAQFVADDSTKVELIDTTTYTRQASTDVGFRATYTWGGIAAAASSKEGYLIHHCGSAGAGPADCAGDPRSALTSGFSLSAGGRMTLGPDHLHRGLATEVIGTASRWPVFAYASYTGRWEKHEDSPIGHLYTGLEEQSASVGASFRAWSAPYGGGTYLDLGIASRLMWFDANDTAAKHTLVDMAVTAQVRFSSLDLIARFAWERHEISSSQDTFSPQAGWIFAFQPTVFF